MGLPLAGKTTWIEDNIDHEDYKLVSADNIKTEHPDYRPLNPELLHEYSVIEAEELLYELIKDNKNIVFDTGSINNSYTKRIISKLTKSKYHIKLVHIKTPFNICIERSVDRYRKVPVDAILKKAVKENAQYYKLEELVDEAIVVNYYSNKNIFVDMDGIIAALSTLPNMNGEIDFVNGEVHRYLKPVMPVINKLREIEKLGYNLFILSATPNSFSTEEKNEWLDKYFPIPKEKRYFVNQGKHKPEMLEDLATKLKFDKRDMMLLDDTHSILYDVKNRNMNCMHVSEFLTHEFEMI